MIYIIDTETTGVSSNDEVIELCSIELSEDLQTFKSLVDNSSIMDIIEYLHNYTTIQRYRPSVPIHPKAFEVHGIQFKDLISCPLSKNLTLPKIKYMIGHNISFDHRMLGKPEVKLICTLFLTRLLVKHKNFDIESASLDNVIKHLYPEHSSILCPKKHTAFIDSIKSILVLNHILKEFPGIKTWDELYNFTLIQKMNKKKK